MTLKNFYIKPFVLIQLNALSQSKQTLIRNNIRCKKVFQNIKYINYFFMNNSMT